ncbi:MAG: PIN domain-containing protein [Microbacteriaceae bacterium]
MVTRAVLLDTDVFSALYVTPRDLALKQGHPVDDWTDVVTGYRVLISFQTRAEILFGAYYAGWGERRLGPMRERLDATPTIDEDRDVVEAFAQLKSECRKSGHALAAKEHTGDRWIAACAIAKVLPLLAKDGIYVNAPSLIHLGAASG